MQRIICCLVIAVFAMPSVLAQTPKLKLLNPDGTPAVDAQAIAIMVPFARVDANLKELPSLDMEMPEGGGTKAVKNEAGEISVDSKALAVVAQNQAGFAFIPLPLKSSSVKLRPWAKLKIDPTAFASQQPEPHSVTVLWENCFAGNAVKPATSAADNDPFGSGEPAPQYDWRFDPIVMWSLTLDTKTDPMVNVPPGEVTLMISPVDIAVASWKGPFANTRFSPLRTLSGKQTTFEMPSFGTIQGKLTDADLPSWNDDEALGRFVYATPAGESQMPDEFLNLFTDLDRGPGTILDELAKRYASEVGMRYRYGLLPTAHARVNDDGTFRFVNLPVGKYKLSLFLPNNRGGMPNLKRRGEADDTLLVVEVTSNALPTDIGEVEVANARVALHGSNQALNQALPQEDPFGSPVPGADSEDPFEKALPPTMTKQAAEARIQSILTTRADSTIEFQATPLWQVIQELQDRYGIPIRIHDLKLAEAGIDLDTPITIALPPMSPESALNHILSSVSDELTSIVRDEVLLISTIDDVTGAGRGSKETSNQAQFALDSQTDSGAKFIEEWLRSAKTGQDAATLRTALQAHLEQEFDANQKARRAELTRLQELLKQSDAWLNDRQSLRGEIIRKKLDELLSGEPGR